MLDHAWAARFSGGFLGVDVFFTLSAFLITTLLLRELEAAGRIDFVGFYWRRVFRLMPALVLFLVFLGPITSVLTHEQSTIGWSTLGSLLYINDFLIPYSTLVGQPYAHTWSLAIEEQFYLVWPFLLLLAHRWLRAGRGLLVVVIGFLVATSAVQFLLPTNYFLPPSHLPALAAGAVLAVAFRGPASVSAGPPRTASHLASLLPALLLIGLYMRPAFSHLNIGRFIETAAGLVAGTLIAVSVAWPGTWLASILGSSPFTYIGRRSYGLYLYHRTLAMLVPLLWTDIKLRLAGPLVIVLAIAVAEVSYRFVETPIRQRGRSWLRRHGHQEHTGRAPGGPPGPVLAHGVSGPASHPVDDPTG